MTAYATREVNGEWGSATWEVRSVNQRYLEVYVRLPEQFRNLYSVIRERMRSRVTRGKVEINLHLSLNQGAQNSMILNKKLAKQLIEAANWVNTQSVEVGAVNPMEVLRWQGVISTREEALVTVSHELMVAMDDLLNNFIAARESEGAILKYLIEKRLDSVNAEVTKVRTHMPNIVQWQRERLITKLEDAQLHLENARIEQELLLMSQRIDIVEELDRLEAHVKETYNILNKKEPVGRRLDFMMQECNRESNTIASKSINIDITASAIEIKVLIEQMREQIQNIE